MVCDRNRELSPQLSNKGTVLLQEHQWTALQGTTNIEKDRGWWPEICGLRQNSLQVLLRRDIHRKIFVSMRLCFIAIFKNDEIPKNKIKVLRLLWAPLTALFIIMRNPRFEKSVWSCLHHKIARCENYCFFIDSIRCLASCPCSFNTFDHQCNKQCAITILIECKFAAI